MSKPLAPPRLAQRRLLGSESYRVSDARCSCPRGSWGAEETVRSTEIVIPRSGIFVREAPNGTVVAEPSRAIWLHEGEPYRIRHPIDGGDRCTVVSFSTTLLEGMLGELGMDDASSLRSLSDAPLDQAADRFHRRLLLLATEPSVDTLTFEETCAGLVEPIVRASLLSRKRTTRHRSATVRAHRELVERCRLLLASRLGESLSLDEVAQAVGCSSFHLCRVFRERTGTTLGAYRRRLRIRVAQEHLAEGRDDLTALALDLGFFDHSHFTRTFCRETGRSPSEWREDHRGSS